MIYPNRGVRTSTPGIAVKESSLDDVSAFIASSLGVISRTQVIRQSHPFASQEACRLRGNKWVLNGSFQHPSWWIESWETLAQICEESSPDEVKDFRVSQPNVVKLRRSDYLDLGWALDLNWLRQAFFDLNLPGKPVYVISEDEESKHFVAPLLNELDCEFKKAPRFSDNPHMDDFWAISAGANIISPNSSFSWWAAAIAGLGRSAKVAYPKPWLPNIWTDESIPDFGIQDWIAVQADKHFLPARLFATS